MDFSYWVSVVTGTGRGSRENDDKHLMWMTRWQWNLFGRMVPWRGSDTEYHENPAGLVALAAVTNQSPYTRFSQDGGGELAGFLPGDPGQYRIDQVMQESAFMYRGFAWQQELHWKEIDDKKSGSITELVGAYLQIGYFFHGLWEWVPKPIEIAYRYAIYDPQRGRPGDLQQENTLTANWFFDGHLNKLTAEVSVFDFEELAGKRDGARFRIQWDISV